MDKKGKFDPNLSLRIVGAVIGCMGFILLIYQKTILGTSLIGIGSVFIASGGK